MFRNDTLMLLWPFLSAPSRCTLVSPIVDSRFPGVTSGSPCHAPGLVATRRGLCLMGHWPPIVVSRFLGVTSGSPCHAPRLVNTRSGQSAWYLVVTWHSARDHF